MKQVKNNRRVFLIKGTLAGLATIALPSVLKAFSTDSGIEEPPSSLMNAGETFSLPALPYAYDALEPHIDKITMEIHHDKHHKAYVDNLNKAIQENSIKASLIEMVKDASKYPVAIRNNGGGHWNHSFFWKLMKSGGGGMPAGKLADAINDSFESFDKFKSAFNDAAMKRFGSGWAWVIERNKKLEIVSTPNQDNPLMDLSEVKGTPIMCIDVWEHAYYLKYQNKRADYVNAWWNVINWEQVKANFASL